LVEREDWVGDFWKYLEQAHLGVERSQMAPSGDDFWHTIRPAFGTVISALKPERIIECGKRLWAAMEDTLVYLRDNVQGYSLSDTNITWCLATMHPSSGRYSWRRLHPLVAAFISDPSEAVAMLLAQ
jgi:hypothetical protein